MVLEDMNIIDNIASFNIKVLTTYKLTPNGHIYTPYVLKRIFGNMETDIDTIRISFPLYINRYINGVDMSKLSHVKCIMYMIKNIYNNNLYDLRAEIQLKSSDGYIFDQLFNDNKLITFELVGEGSVGDNHYVEDDYQIKGILLK